MFRRFATRLDESIALRLEYLLPEFRSFVPRPSNSNDDDSSARCAGVGGGRGGRRAGLPEKRRDSGALLLGGGGGGAEDDAGEASPGGVRVITSCEMHVYGLWRGFYGMSYIVYGGILLAYTEVFGMAMEAMMVGKIVGKCFDLFLSFAIGHWSDTIDSPFGRRRPFIVAALPFMAVGGVLLANPPVSITASGQRMAAASDNAFSSNVGSLDPCAALAGGDCDLLRKCVAASIESGELPPWHVETTTAGHSGVKSDSPWLPVWFVAFFIVRFSIGVIVAIIPFEAFGQDLGSQTSPENKRRLYEIKTMQTMVGNMCGVGAFAAALAVYPTAINKVVLLLTLLFTVLQIFSTTVLCCVVGESKSNNTPASDKGKADGKGGGKGGGDDKGGDGPNDAAFIPTIRDMMFKNVPYRYYLGMRLCLTFITDLPYVVRPYFIKYVLQVENNPATANTMAFIFLVSCLVVGPILSSLSKRFSVLYAMAGANLGVGIMVVSLSVVEQTWLAATGLIFLYAAVEPFVGLGAFFQMDTVLNGVIQCVELKAI